MFLEGIRIPDSFRRRLGPIAIFSILVAIATFGVIQELSAETAIANVSPHFVYPARDS